MTGTAERKVLLEVKDLHVSYGAIKALSGVSLKVFEGEIVSVIGSNGAGKSTLMNAIMAMVRREKGKCSSPESPSRRRATGSSSRVFP
jgi:amino acid/amide ABC transporter ATP-binding protein 2, HAAT family (TC 3.A.1.4.-)